MSDPRLHARASELFLKLRAIAPADREDALALESRGNERLRDEVRSLLAHDEAEPQATRSIAAAGDDHPDRIGPYRVIARIGQGGSGQVFLAEQDEPVRRRVALKIVPQAALDRDLAARFDVERRALECTDHPGIARILDAGRTPDGLPYLVMDYVEGASITEHCERAHPTLEQRVELVLAVADAVLHAHQRGVIHRDLKPANILVSSVDGRPRVVDFGIAKTVAGRFDGEAPRTSGLPIGTPSYMAPEQTGVGEIDTRADVYALGAVLYELVAGRPPIDGAGDLVAVLGRIRERVPPPASRARAANGLAPMRSRIFARDLDCVIAKALEKSPDRRYATVGALSDDLRRLVRREPIEARGPSALYRAKRFAQRNRALVAASAAVATAAVIGVLGLAFGLLEARRQRENALDQIDAQAEVHRFLTDDLLAAASPERQGQNATVLDVVHAASENIEQRFPERPKIAAAVHHTLGEAFAALGVLDRAESHLARAIELRRASGGIDSPDTVRSEIAAASLIARRERYALARPALEAAVERARRVLGPDDRDLYAALNDLGVALEGLGEHDHAATALRESLDGRSRLLGASDPEVLETLANLAFVQESRGDVEAALELMHAGLRAAKALENPPRMTLLGFHNNIGATYQDLGRDQEAASHVREAARIAGELLGPDHPATLTIRGNVAGLESELGEPRLAAEIYREIAEIRAALIGPTALETLMMRYGYWNALAKAGEHGLAVDGFAELADDAVESLGESHWLVPQTRSALAGELVACGERERALPLALEAVERMCELYGPDHHRTRSASAVLETIRVAQPGE